MPKCCSVWSNAVSTLSAVQGCGLRLLLVLCQPKFLHGQSREMVSYAVIYPRNIRYAHMVVPCGCHKEKVVHQGYEVWAPAGALLPNGYHSCIVAVEEYALACPEVAPSGASSKNSIHLFPRNA